MKNVIIGTSGHVDHGKTCLIKALTGTDCDRLKEEKKRGITIENGFADFSYRDYNISIIDVPGHEKFVRNMLMGIGGIDLVLLIVALDEGVMPQTIEHFRILSMLNLSRGIIVYTKRDLVEDNDWISMVKDDTRNLVKGTFMEGADEIEVSSFNGYNIDGLKDLIVNNIDDTKLKNDDSSLFRLPIDRVFTIDGFGTVITGTLIEGKVSVGDEIMLYPKKILTKVRNVQVHNEKVETAYAGQRTALNLQGLKKEDIDRGTVLSIKDSLIPTKAVDVKLSLFKDSERWIYNDSRVHFYTGASESVAKVVLLDRDVLKEGETCYATLRLDDEVVCKRNDSFIVRFFSPLISIGGGKILEENPYKHKRHDEEALKTLKVKDEGSISDIAKILVKENLLTIDELKNKLRISKKEIDEILSKTNGIRVLENSVAIGDDRINYIKEIASNILKDFHKENEMAVGISKEEFRTRLSRNINIYDKKLIDLILNILANEKTISIEENFVRLFSFKQNISAEVRNRILKRYEEARFEMPTIDEVLLNEKDKKNGRHVIESLLKEGELVKLNDVYLISKGTYEEALKVVKAEIDKNGSISLATFRDLVGTSRKYAIPILEYLDEKKITKMVNEVRMWNLNN